MTRARKRWKIVGATSGAFVAAFLFVAIIISHRYRVSERTYYGPHTDLLRVGEHVMVAGGQPVGAHREGIVQDEPAWDDDSCDPDRPIKIALTSGEAITVPRHLLHRE